MEQNVIEERREMLKKKRDSMMKNKFSKLLLLRLTRKEMLPKYNIKKTMLHSISMQLKK